MERKMYDYKTTEQVKLEVEQIVTALKANNYQAINDHKSNGDTYTIIGVVVDMAGNIQAMIDAPVYCLNELYVDENNIPHLSQRNIGSVIYNHRTTVDEYNENKKFTEYNKISKVIMFGNNKLSFELFNNAELV